MVRERSASRDAVESDKKEVAKVEREGKEVTKGKVSTSNRGRERDRRRRGGSASSSSESSGSSSDSSSSRSSSGSDSRSSSSSSSASSSSSSSSSTASERSGGSNRRRGRGNGVTRKSASHSRSLRRSKSPQPNGTKLKRSETGPVVDGINAKRERRTRSRSTTRSPRRRVRNSIERSPPPKRRERSPTPRPVRIHIARLSRNVSKEHVTEIFSCFGEVKVVEFPPDRFHPTFGRGIAYVEYATPDECEAAMKQMDGGQIDGQEISISPVLVPKSRPPVRRASPMQRRNQGRWRSPPNYNRFNNRGRRSPLRGRRSPQRRPRSRTPIRRRRRSNSSDSSR